MDVRVARVVDDAGNGIETRVLADERWHSLRKSRVFAYIYAGNGFMRGVTAKRIAELVHFRDWDGEGNEWFGAEPSVAITVDDGDSIQRLRLVAMIRSTSTYSGQRLKNK
jgi:hypothetical protein